MGVVMAAKVGSSSASASSTAAHLRDGGGQQLAASRRRALVRAERMLSIRKRAQGQLGRPARPSPGPAPGAPRRRRVAGSNRTFQLGPPALGEVPGEGHGGVVGHHPADRQRPCRLQGHETAVAVRHHVAGSGLPHHRCQVSDLHGRRVIGRLVRGTGPSAPVVAMHGPAQHPADFRANGRYSPSVIRVPCTTTTPPRAGPRRPPARGPGGPGRNELQLKVPLAVVGARWSVSPQP